MSNVIAPYDPIWYANKFVERLEKRLTFVRTFSRDFDEQPREKGSTIEFKRPGGFQATSMPQQKNTQDLKPTRDTIVLNEWKGVQFGLDDKELAYSGEEIIRHHIDPAVHAVAEEIERTAIALYADIPWELDYESTAADGLKDFIAVRRALNEASVPFGARSLALNHEREAAYLGLNLFASAEKSSEGPATQREGFLGRKMGLDTFTAPLLGNHSKGTLTGTPTLSGAHAQEAKQITLAATSLSGSVKRGDTLALAGNSQRYAVTADATAAGNAITVNIFPALVQDYADTTAVTVRQKDGGVNIGYHEEAFAIVMAPLSDAGNGKGAEIGVAIDPETGLAIRAMRWYDPGDKKHFLSFDALWGVKTIDPNKAVRLLGPALT